MSEPLITDAQALKEAMLGSEQGSATALQSELPAYLETFLAQLRLLIGVPFTYLVPDEQLLPEESIRFFYLDRSWTDRLVDGVFAVGKIGSREQAHHAAHGHTISERLDRAERLVRTLQCQSPVLAEAENLATGEDLEDPANTVTGLLLRSALVSGWPDMEVRAFAEPHQRNPLRLLRLDLIGSGIMLALFDGVAQQIYIEEPHHGVPLGLEEKSTRQKPYHVVQGRQPAAEHGGLGEPTTSFWLELKQPETGQQLLQANGQPIAVQAPMRETQPTRRVVDVGQLAQKLEQELAKYDAAQAQQSQQALTVTSAALAVELLNPPWRESFDGEGAAASKFTGTAEAEHAGEIDRAQLSGALDVQPVGAFPEAFPGSIGATDPDPETAAGATQNRQQTDA